jgi:hypothetical protein
MAWASTGPTGSPARRSTRRYLERFPGGQSTEGRPGPLASAGPPAAASAGPPAPASPASPDPPIPAGPARPMLTPTRRHGRPRRALCAPAAATAAATSRAVTSGPDRSTSVTASASRTGRSRDGATRSAGRTSLPTSPRTSGTRRPDPHAPAPRPRSTPGPRGSGPRRGSVAEEGTGCSRLSTAPGRTRAARRVTRLWPSKAAWWQATATRVPPDPATTRTGGWVARSKWATSSGASRGSPSTVSSSGGGPGCQVSRWRRAPVIGTARCSASIRSWSRSTGADRVAAATTAQVVRRSGKRSRASALAEAGAGRPGRPAIARPPGSQVGPPAPAGDPRTGPSANTPRPAVRERPAGGTTAVGSIRWRTREDAAHS